MSYDEILKKYVKAQYGNWLLVQLPSSKWAAVWHAVLGIEEMCEAVLTGSARFDGDKLTLSYTSADGKSPCRAVLRGQVTAIQAQAAELRRALAAKMSA